MAGRKPPQAAPGPAMPPMPPMPTPTGSVGGMARRAVPGLHRPGSASPPPPRRSQDPRRRHRCGPRGTRRRALPGGRPATGTKAEAPTLKTRPAHDAPRSPGVWHVPLCVQMKTHKLPSDFHRSHAVKACGRGGNGQPSMRRRGMAYVRYPGCRHGHVTDPPRKQGLCRLGLNETADILTRPRFSGGGWGFRSGSNVPQ